MEHIIIFCLQHFRVIAEYFTTVLNIIYYKVTITADVVAHQQHNASYITYRLCIK